MDAIPKEQLVEGAIQGTLQFDPEFQICRKSRYKDARWDFTDDNNERLNAYNPSKLIIDWDCHKGEGGSASEAEQHSDVLLPPRIIEELKFPIALYSEVPHVFGFKGHKRVHPSVVVSTARALVRFLSDVYLNSYFVTGAHRAGTSHIKSLGDIALYEIKYALDRQSTKDQTYLRRGLQILAHPITRKYLGDQAELWLLADIRAMDFKKSARRDDYEGVMPPELFRLISSTATNDIGLFMESLGGPRADKCVLDWTGFEKIIRQRGRGMFDDYVVIRSKDREKSIGSRRRTGYTQTERKVFKKTYGMAVVRYKDFIMRTKWAAQAIVAQYTGGRFSDLVGFKHGCIEKRDNYWLLKGTLVKGVDLGKPCGSDVWPAIPIMRDAIATLELISLITFDPFLLSNGETKRKTERVRPQSLSGFAGAINAYLRLIDVTGRWNAWKINSHQFRHTLANQLARADLGLIYISIHMHHFYTALRALPPEVTLAYGNIGDLKQERALQMGAAYEEAAKALYDPDMPIAGGGAEDYANRRKEYFAGMQAQGWTKEEVILKLSKQGLPFANVGAAYCGGRREIRNKDGTKELPPCMGSLQCNPKDCKQAVITKVHEPVWQKVQAVNRDMAADERFAYAKETFVAMAAEAEVVLKELASK